MTRNVHKIIESARISDGNGDGRSGNGDIVTERKTRTKSKTAKPPLYKVILLNDDYTPMEFVVEVEELARQAEYPLKCVMEKE